MPFEVQGEEALTVRVSVRMTPAEKAQLQEQASVAGLTVSDLMRRRAFNRPVVASVELEAVRELRRLGGLLKHLHNESGGANSTETLATLSELRAAIGRLGR